MKQEFTELKQQDILIHLFHLLIKQADIKVSKHIEDLNKMMREFDMIIIIPHHNLKEILLFTCLLISWGESVAYRIYCTRLLS